MLKMAAVQIEASFGEVAQNINMERVVAAVREAASAGARLIVVPELVDTGYMFESRAEALALAHEIPGGTSSRQLAEAGAQALSPSAERRGQPRLRTSGGSEPLNRVLPFSRPIERVDDERAVPQPAVLVLGDVRRHNEGAVRSLVGTHRPVDPSESRAEFAAWPS